MILMLVAEVEQQQKTTNHILTVARLLCEEYDEYGPERSTCVK